MCPTHQSVSTEGEQHAQQGSTWQGGGFGGGVEQVEKIRVNRATHLASVMHAWRGGSASV